MISNSSFAIQIHAQVIFIQILSSLCIWKPISESERKKKYSTCEVNYEKFKTEFKKKLNLNYARNSVVGESLNYEMEVSK